MADSSNSACQKSGNTSRISNRNPKPLHRPNSNLYNIYGSRERETAELADTDNHINQCGLSGIYKDEIGVDPYADIEKWGDLSLRQWLDKPERHVDSSESLHIFKQIVEIINLAHSQGIVVHNVRPSCFVMSSFNHVSFIESASCSDSGGDSPKDGENSEALDGQNESLPLPRSMGGDTSLQLCTSSTISLSEASCMQSNSYKLSLVEEAEKDRIRTTNAEEKQENKQQLPLKQILVMEACWYTSPEEASGGQSSFSSDVYQLGVLLFELFCSFSSREEKSRTMSSLRHRVLPPQLLLKWPKEASFCLWLLHPDPNSRPKLSELSQTDFLNEQKDEIENRESAIEIREKIEEQELLLEILLLIQQRKQEASKKLQDSITLLCSDIEEVTNHQSYLQQNSTFGSELGIEDRLASVLPSASVVENDESVSLGCRKRVRPRIAENETGVVGSENEKEKLHIIGKNRESYLSGSSRLMKHFKNLELAYISMRCQPNKPQEKQSVRHSSVCNNGKGSITTEKSSVYDLVFKLPEESRKGGWINPFLEGLCKYLTYNKLKIKADVKHGDLSSSSNLVCSLGFDRDGEFFATAGVNKKIKVFEYNPIINEEHNIHYPVVEMASDSKLSSVCWNSYIKSQIASSNFAGVVQVWDVSRRQLLTEMKEHERRIWSIDFSSADPMMLASGSDDGSVKLWSINQGASIGTIKTKANVCCVQFPTDSSRSIAFGSADHRIYYYDLRNMRAPLCSFVGHNKTVSYVKFVDSTNLVSASTDNTLKLWDLSKCMSRVVDTPLQSFTGHVNGKNFVGLSVSDGYIATGSETNEVFIYHKAFPMPSLSFKFQRDPFSLLETDESSQFISSVCWRRQSATLVAANSAGSIKILEMA